MSDKKIPKFTHLHVHTHYSLLDGLGKIDDLLDRAKEMGMDSLAITDHGVMYGAPEFYDKAKQRGIKPIIGCEFYVAPNGMENKQPKVDEDRYHLILLAKNDVGYKKLMKLASEAHLKGFYYKPRIDLKILKEYAGDLIGMSACIQGEIPNLILADKFEEAKNKALEYQKILGVGNFYLEIQHLPNLKKQKTANDGLIRISKEAGIPLVATADIHYVDKEDSEVQDALICIQMNKKISDENRMTMRENALHLKSPQEMYEQFKDVPEALENTQKIVEACNIEIEFGNTKLPYFEVPKKYTPETYLRKLCDEGLVKRYGDKKNTTTEHKERMEYELGIISKMGFSSYFLIVQDFMNWAKKQNIVVGPGRGSAAGSFVSYLIGITNIDPIEYNLLFERFLNPDRISMPDVDADFADNRRGDVIDYVTKKYGEDHVAQIITFGTMAARAAVRDAGRVLGVEYSYCDKLAKMIPMFTKLNEALKSSQELINEYNSNPEAKKVIDIASRLEGVARHASVHACGVVITAEPVTEYSPLQYMAGKKGSEQSIVTQYSSSSKSSYVEKIGLLKMDFLGLKNLTIIENALKVIEKTVGDKINIEEIPLDDEKTFKLLQQGGTTGVFQLESSGMKRYLKKLKPTVFEDLIAMVALYRPGPMEWIPDFIDGKHGVKKIKYIHPKLKPILENTYGVAVYQEQVMQIAREVAGFSPGEADVLRKAMGKKIVDLIQEEKKKFIQGCVDNNIEKALAEEIFSFIEPFAGYGFNRSHAACYALIGYQTAYLKAHYPTQFMAALLNADKDDIDRIAIEIEEARQMGIEVLPPNVNESFKDFAVIMKGEEESKSIRFGLEAIKGVGENIAEKIIEERKKKGAYKDIIELVERIQDKDMNKRSLEALAKSGALDSVIERNKLIQNIEIILSYAKDFQKNQASGQSSLFSLGEESNHLATPKINLEEVSDAPKNQRLSWEKELLGLYISDHPLRQYQEYFATKATPIHKLSRELINQSITIGGIITKIHKIYTRNNQLMYFVTVEDGIGKIEALIFPKTLEKDPDIWKEEKILLLKGRLSDKDNEYKLLCEKGITIDKNELEKFKNNTPQDPNASFGSIQAQQTAKPLAQPVNKKQKIILYLKKDCLGNTLEKISSVLSETERGFTRVFITTNGGNKKLETPFQIELNDKIKQTLENLIGDENIEIKES